MNVGISEFSFGYAYLHEQTNAKWSGIKAVPILPNLRQEAKEGWDAKLPTKGGVFYYQFKVSDHMKWRNSALISDGTYSTPYFKFHLHPNNKYLQHRRLRRLSKSRKHVSYVTQELESADAFNDAFLQKSVVQNSRNIPLQKCDDITEGGSHIIAFQSGTTEFHQCSDPHRIEGSIPGSEIIEYYRQSSSSWRDIDEEFAAQELATLIERAKSSLIEESSDTSSRFQISGRISSGVNYLSDHDEFENLGRLFETKTPDPLFAPITDADLITHLTRARDVAAVFFGLTMVVVGTD